jgi:iron uptake system component EfeO
MGPEPGGGANDGPDAKLPQGLLEPAASAAGMGKDGNLVVSVSSTDTTCMPDKRVFPAGTVWFRMTNHSKQINEMYLETTKGEELIEVEKIKTGMSGAFKTTVKPGNWVIACEPGMADQQVLTGITVTK